LTTDRYWQICWDHDRVSSGVNTKIFKLSNSREDNIEVDPQEKLCNINNQNDAVVVSEVPSFTLNEEELVQEDNPHQDDEQS
jgi:hypothetical protein